MRMGIVLLVCTAACHPLTPFVPPPLPGDAPLVVQSRADWPGADVQILVDDLGIPHIYGQSQPDLAYALGLMHGRDRSFQVFLYVHAAEGRLTELLGDDVLELDRANRLLMYGLDDQLKAGNARDAEMLRAYCSGLNEGARMAGRTAEMAVLGVDWEPVTPRDVLAIARLQQWDQGIGFQQEMTRWRLVKALGRDSPVVKELMIDTPTGGVPIVSAAEDEAKPLTAGAPTASSAPASSAADSTSASRARPPEAGDALRASLTEDVAAEFGRGGTGASNSWSVSPEHTKKGVAVVANDPHLQHMAPGVFYLADMHVGDEVFAGGTFPGIPAVLIGHGRHIAWGVTNAYADTQDVVVIARDATGYVVDGVHHDFGKWPQKFGAHHEEEWLTTIYGPVLPKGYGSFGGQKPMVDDDETLALLWTAQQFPYDNGRPISAFWNLAASKNVDDATRAVEDFASPAMSVNMAFTDGTIAYRLSGIIPVRTSSERADFPRHSGWSGRVPASQKPQETNPKKGYIVASNQRVLDEGVGAQRYVGFEGARPFRAMRIDTRVRALIEDGKKADTDDLLAIQQDITAKDAQELGPIFAAHCPKQVEGHSDDEVEKFCADLKSFNGVFSADSNGLPYARTSHAFMENVLKAHVDATLADDLTSESWAAWALEDVVVAEHNGKRSAVLAPRGLDGFTAIAVKEALDLVDKEAGDDWHWGKLHTLSLRGVLARAPLIGAMFQTDAREESGFDTTPRAEHPDYNHAMRVTAGAGLRLIAEMTDPPTVRMVNDSGQSGHFGSRHLEDQYPLWHDGKPRVISLDVGEAEKRKEGALSIKPRKR